MTSVAAILGTIVAVAVVGAVTVLGWHGTLDGETVAGLFGMLIGGGVTGGSVAAHTAVQNRSAQ